ncbi:class I SAM-dependent methyltransferase [Aureitalea marina]|uniref:SAM-dependent methyltransferase n=1 Tax=Aureitalea marina TaxID=930804 RepID=A0A2S7KQD5_9FLAO|nr:class I SAM-dependent methyltransferase [Aureitalea marina]PQB04835.1 SAM-dependent methyltransferase [Aureitalea marina]
MQDIFGQALLDYQLGDHHAEILTETNISEEEAVPVQYFFRMYDDMPPLEQIALQRSDGKVLDVGCGAGSHSLWLQQQGLDVHAIDISPGAVQAARLRGVKDVEHRNLLDVTGTTYDTILMLMNGSGIMEKLDKVPFYLDQLKKLITPTGQVLLDSSDLQYLYPEGDDGAIWIPAGRYYGEVDYWVSYKNEKSHPFPMLYLDSATLSELARAAGWQMEIVQEGEHFDYLARLTLL